MAMKKNIQDCIPLIDKSLADEFDLLAGCNPIWILNWLTNRKYILKPKQRIVISPSTKEELLKWVKSDAFSSNCASLEHFMNGTASEPEMLEYAKELIRNIEYETDPKELEERLKSAQWILNETKLEIKEL